MAVQFDDQTYGFAIIAAVQRISSLTRGDRFTITQPQQNGAALFGRQSQDSGRDIKVRSVQHEEILPDAQYAVVEISHEHWATDNGSAEGGTNAYDSLVEFMTALRSAVRAFHAERPDSAFLILCGEVMYARVMNGHCGQLMIPVDPFRIYGCPRHGFTEKLIYTMYRFDVIW